MTTQYQHSPATCPCCGAETNVRITISPCHDRPDQVLMEIRGVSEIAQKEVNRLGTLLAPGPLLSDSTGVTFRLDRRSIRFTGPKCPPHLLYNATDPTAPPPAHGNRPPSDEREEV